MSTKIYNGFRINAGSALANLNLLRTLSPGVQARVDLKMHKLLAERVAYEVDQFCITREELAGRDPLAYPENWAQREARYIWGHVLDKVLEKQREGRKSLQRYPLEDCDVELFLRADPDTGMLLGYLQEERTGAYEYLLTVPGVEDYAYWNNSDPPEELTDEQWDQRKQAWDKVLDDRLPCLSVRFEPGYPRREQLSAYYPSHAKRACDRARAVLANRAAKAWVDQEEAQGRDVTDSFSGIARALRLAEKAMDTEGEPLRVEFLALEQHLLRLLPAQLGELLHMAFKDLPGMAPTARQPAPGVPGATNPAG